MRKSGVLVPGEQILAFLPEGQVRVHAAPVIIEQRFRHKRYGFTMLSCGIFYYVLVFEHVVRHFNKRSEAHIDLRLAARCNFMVLAFNGDADVLKRQHHFASNILLTISRRDGKISFFVAGFVAKIWILLAA